MTTRYTKSHEYVRVEGGTGIVGITDYAQSQLGDVVFVELPPIGQSLSEGAEAATVESVKAASEVNAPVSGTVVDVNSALTDSPGLVNEDPSGKGWFLKIKLSDATELDRLMDEDAYREFLKAVLSHGSLNLNCSGLTEVSVLCGRRVAPRSREAKMRYLPLNDEDRTDMLARIGVNGIDALFADIPKAKRLEHDLDLPPRKTEMEVERLLSGLAAKNVAAGSVPFFVGAGAYKHHVPASVDHLIQRSEFLTSYTPYQPEIAQGTLQTIFEFQTQVAALTSMDVANASMYDGSTATVEAVAMARRITKRRKAILSGGLHPHYAEAVRTYSAMSGDAVAALPPDVFAAENLSSVVDDETACVVVQSPDLFGNLRDLSGAAAIAMRRARF